MKILQINTVCGWGSTGRIVLDLAETLIDSGHDCFIAYGQKSTDYKNSFKIGTYFENKWHNIGSRLYDRQGNFTQNGTRRLIEWIKKINPDIIHLHNLHGNYLNFKILFDFLKSSKIPVVWTLHDCWPFTGHCAYFDYVNCNKWKILCNNCPNKRNYPSSLFIDQSTRNYLQKSLYFNSIRDKLVLVAPSIWLSERVKESFLKDCNIKVINNGINLNVFTTRDTTLVRKKLGIRDECVLLGVASDGFYGRKGLNYFLQLDQRLDESFKIILIGATKKDISKISEKIIAIKRTQNSIELSEYYSMADLYINPTLEDNFPTTNLEALACGTPVITFDTGGSGETIDEKSGRVIKKGDEKELTSTIINQGNNLKILYADHCRKRASRLFDKEKRYRNYMSLYKEISGKHD